MAIVWDLKLQFRHPTISESCLATTSALKFLALSSLCARLQQPTTKHTNICMLRRFVSFDDDFRTILRCYIFTHFCWNAQIYSQTDFEITLLWHFLAIRYFVQGEGSLFTPCCDDKNKAKQEKTKPRRDDKNPSDCDMIHLKFIHEFVTLGRNKTKVTIHWVNHKSNQVHTDEKWIKPDVYV